MQVIGFFPAITEAFFNELAYCFERRQVKTWSKATYTDSVILKSQGAQKSDKKSQRDDDKLAWDVDFLVNDGSKDANYEKQS